MVEQDVLLVDDLRTQWSGSSLAQALHRVVVDFEPHVPVINALNVFPVPDGDTGTNMFLTLRAAVAEVDGLVRGQEPDAGLVLSAATHGALMGARGNSGVILYQIIAGFCRSAEHESILTGEHLAAGLRLATDLAYQAVVTPVEGTMLTVIREATEAVEREGPAGRTVEAVLATALPAAEAALQRTPLLLDRLRQAGVVDSGGQGVVEILRSLRRFAGGQPPDPNDPALKGRHVDIAAAMDFLDQLDVEHELDSYGYCTNFVVTGEGIDVARFTQAMNDLGTSAVVVGDSQGLKVHLHSEHPGRILEAALGFGELHQVRIDNMAAQTQRLLAARAAARPEWAVPEALPDRAGIAVIAVASGTGLSRALMGMGAKTIVPGGPSFNPSTRDILDAIEAVSQDSVIILPNDSNVIPTARQAARVSEKTIRVVESRTVPEGISALATFNFDRTLEENVAAMSGALPLVTSLSVTRASRAAELDGISVAVGQFIGLADDGLQAAGDEPVAVVLTLLERVGANDAELLTVYVGEPAEAGLGEAVADAIKSAYPDLALELVQGDQPHYHLILSLE